MWQVFDSHTAVPAQPTLPRVARAHDQIQRHHRRRQEQTTRRDKECQALRAELEQLREEYAAMASQVSGEWVTFALRASVPPFHSLCFPSSPNCSILIAFESENMRLTNELEEVRYVREEKQELEAMHRATNAALQQEVHRLTAEKMKLGTSV